MSEHDCIDLCRLIEQIAREFHDQQPGRTEALRAHATLLGLWFVRRAAPSPAVAAQVGTQDPLVERYRMLIEANYRKHWPVRAYAAALAVTPDHLSRRCRAATGLGALDMAQERLLVEARRLLAYTPTTVTEIAHHLGFEDPAYFSRLFTRSTGQSPSTYRAAMADGLGVPPLADTAPPERPPDL
jgi:AraC family transcriptional activator of pobA